MNVLEHIKHSSVFHVTPLHYLPLILGSGQLLSKSQLLPREYSPSHFRKTSQKQDSDRGFSDFIHLSLQEWPPILESKLSKGFPHARLRIPTDALGDNVDLCRYNIARTRKIKDGKSPATESATNGYYYEELRVPVARQPQDQEAMLKRHQNEMIEVLVSKKLDLGKNVEIECFSQHDCDVVRNIIHDLNVSFNIAERGLEFDYPEHEKYRDAVINQINRFTEDPTWKGNGLDFDKLK